MRREAHVLPAWLAPVLAFVNTVDVETGVDELAQGPAALSAWLSARGLLAAGAAGVPATAAVPVSRIDFRLAIDLRSGLRCLALRNNGVSGDESATTRLRLALDKLPLVVEPSAGGVSSGSSRPALLPYRLGPARAALGVLVAGFVHAMGTGDWARIRRCPAEDCAWVFWDSSAKGARRWCTMSVCGNRAKVRAFTERRSGRPTPS